MGKVAQALITGFWPDRVPRRIGVPQQPLAKLLARAAKGVDGEQRVLGGGRSLTYQALFAQAETLAAGLATLTSAGDAIAVVESAPEDTLALAVGGLLAGCKVAIVEQRHAQVLADAHADSPLALLVADVDLPGGGALPFPVAATADVRARAGEGAGGVRASRWRDVAIRIPSNGVLVSHSHVGAAAMATNLKTFIPAIGELDVVLHGPLCSWAGFAGALTALLSGRTIVVEPEASAGWEPATTYAILSRSQAEAIVDERRAPDYLRRLQLLFVEVTDFRVRWRRRLEDVLGRVVLPIYGAAEFGPAIAAHPSWVPLEVHGLPLVNVSLVPLDPADGGPSEVPWEMLRYAELGIESPSNFVDAGDEHSQRQLTSFRGNPVVRTGRTVSVDGLGLVRFFDG